MERPDIWSRMQNIDRRYLYVLLMVVMILPIFNPIPLPMFITNSTQMAYDVVEKIPKHGFAIVSCTWAGGTKAENQPQTEAILRHLMKRGIKVCVLSADPVGATFSYNVAAAIAKEYNYKYGTQWVHLGWIQQPYIMAKAMKNDIQGAFIKDRNGTPCAKLPIFKGIKTIKNVDYLVEITGTAFYQMWIGLLVKSTPNLKFVCALTAVMAPESYPLLQSGQMNGLLEGMKGAAEYEKLIGVNGSATAAMGAVSWGHVLIMVLIVLGNIGYVSQKRRKAKG
ncbi:MAG: hypothetical protein ACYC1M_08840 [Armatimonadota bacterium]